MLDSVEINTRKGRRMLKRLVFLLVTMLIVAPLIILAGCSGGTLDLVAFVPQKANLVGEINVSQILSDEDFADIYDRLPKENEDPQTLREALDAFENDSDIDLRDFERGVFFSDTSVSVDDGGYFGVIIEGDFDREDLLNALESSMGEELDVDEYKGYDIYSNEDETSAVAFLSPSVFVMGQISPVKDVIQVKDGNREALGGDVIETYNELGDALIKMVSLQAYLGEETLPDSLPGLPIDLSPFADIEKSTLVLNKQGHTISMETKLYFSNSESAESAENLVSFIELLVDMLPVPEEGQNLVAELLGKLDIERDGSLLTISFEITVSEIEDIIESGNTA